MPSELFPDSGQIEKISGSNGWRWNLLVSERGNRMADIQFFTRSFTDAEDARVLVTRNYEPDTDWRNQQLTDEREATPDEMVEFALAAREQFPDDPITNELNTFVKAKLDEATKRLGSTAMIGVEAE